MPVTIKRKSSPGEIKVAVRTEKGTVWVVKKVKRVGHTKAKALTISLDEPGRLRVAHMLNLLSVSHSAFYAGLKAGKYPPADGRDGNFPYWKTATMKQFLET